MPVPSNFFTEYEKLLLRNVNSYSQRIQDLYNKAIVEISIKANGVNIKDKSFDINDYPEIRKKIATVLEDLKTEMTATINQATKKAWDLSASKNNAMVETVLGKYMLPDRFKKVLFNPNEKALAAFQKRATNGLKLSDRVFKVLEPFKTEIENSLKIIIDSGQSAKSAASDMKKYLKEPDKLFRRVRDSNGKLQLSEAAKAYKPGQGVYRSSFKNALRLTRTEINMGYRAADTERWQQLKFVLGVEIKLSNQHPKYDICDPCAGKYPKDFIWGGWHPQCLCYRVPILATDEQNKNIGREILGLKPKEGTPELKYIAVTPDGFRQYYIDHEEQIAGWKNKPYWLADNEELINGDTKIYKFLLKARENGDYITALGQEFADRYKGTVSDINFKNFESSKRKINNDYSGDILGLKDAARNTVVVATKDLDKVVDALRKDVRFDRIKYQREEEQYFGYRGVITNLIGPNGVYGEMQVNTPGMIYAKVNRKTAEGIIGPEKWLEISKATGLEGGLGHDFYDKIRVIDPETATENDVKRRRKLIQESISYYSKFYTY